MAELLDLEELDRDLYRGVNEVPDNGRPTLFGGQVAAQALRAAGTTVADDRAPHSMHGYFLRPGRRNRPVIFKVERDRDGRSFSARRVSAVQDGEVIFDMTASFHVAEPGGEFAIPVREGLGEPDAYDEDTTIDNYPLAEVRLVPPTWDDGQGHSLSPTMWVRIRETLSDDPLIRCCALAYLSDIGTGFSTVEVLGLARTGPSLDHAIWFREPIRVDEWVLLHMWPLMAGGARGLYLGSMHGRDGRLGAMLTQEGLLREPQRAPDRSGGSASA
jgi:acyl-CoA thioesterase-2